MQHWEKLYADFNKSTDEDEDEVIISSTAISNNEEETQSKVLSIQQEEANPSRTCFQFKNKYILTPVKSGLMVIDQKRARNNFV